MTLHDDSKTAPANPRRESLVAWYGDKPAAFELWLRELGADVSAAIGTSFEPYSPTRIHATITDLGVVFETGSLEKGEAHARAAEEREGKLRELEQWLLAELCEPMKIRFGGPQHDLDVAPRSRGRPRGERCFSIQGDKVVLIGWCLNESRLGDLRRGCERFGFVHRYHRGPGAETDQDCYLRLGLIADLGQPTHDDERRRRIHESIRASLCSTSRELVVEIGGGELSIVRYDDETLPIETSRARKLLGDQAPPGA